MPATKKCAQTATKVPISTTIITWANRTRKTPDTFHPNSALFFGFFLILSLKTAFS